MSASCSLQAIRLGPTRPTLDQRCLKLQPEQLEWHRSIDRHQQITMRVQTFAPMLQLEKSRLPYLDVPCHVR